MSVKTETANTATQAATNNLVSDSVLVDDAIRLVRASGARRVAATELAERVLQISDLPDDIAASFIAELVGGDARLNVTADFYVELVEPVNARATLDETDFVIVDVETTGAKLPGSRITEIGAYRVRQGRIVAEFESLINPQQTIPAFIQSLTGITNAMVADAPTFADLANDWLRFADCAVLVAHNAAFDVRFINSEIARSFPNRRMINAHLCTVALSRRLVPGLENYRLHTVANHFSIPIINRHRAAGDAHATAKIFLHLLERLRERQVTSLAAARFVR